MFTFEWGVDSYECPEGLGFNHFCVQYPCSPLTEDNIEIFCMIDEEYIPSSQCKMSQKGPNSMRKVYIVSLIVINFYVPAITPRINNIKTSLQLSANITLFALCRITRVSSAKRPT
jgi:hypothetical protein